MRITQIDTVTLDEFPNLLFIEIHRDAGFTGLGETFFGAPEVATYIHASAARASWVRTPPRSRRCESA